MIQEWEGKKCLVQIHRCQLQKSVPIGAWEMKLNYDSPTDRPTIRPKNRLMAKFHLQQGQKDLRQRTHAASLSVAGTLAKGKWVSGPRRWGRSRSWRFFPLNHNNHLRIISLTYCGCGRRVGVQGGRGWTMKSRRRNTRQPPGRRRGWCEGGEVV